MSNTANRQLLVSYLSGTQATQAMGRSYTLNPSGFTNNQNITATGSATVTRNTTTPLTSISDLSLTFANNATDTLYWATNTLDNEMSGQNCEFRFVYTASSIGSNVVAVIRQGASVIAKSLPLGTTTVPRVVSLNGPCGDLSAVTTVGIINDTGNTGTSAIKVANLAYGRATNLSNVSQAQFIGSAFFDTTASCEFARTSTVLGPMTDADCPGPTVELNPGPGTIQTTDFNAPKVAVNNLPAGTYLAHFVGSSYLSTSPQDAAFAINDGTDTRGQASAPGSAVSSTAFHIVAPFVYTTSGNRTFELYASSLANEMRINLNTGNSRLYFYLEQFPSSSQIAYNASTDNALGSAKTAGASGCAWDTTSGTYANFAPVGACSVPTVMGSATAPGTKIPGAVFSNIPAGSYLVQSNGSFRADFSGSTTECFFRLSDGTNTTGTSTPYAITGEISTNSYIGGIVTYSSFQPSVTWQVQAVRAGGGGICRVVASDNRSFEISLIPLNQSLPAPLLVGSVTSNSNGLERIERASLVCANSSYVNSQSGNWLSGFGNIGSGYCTVTILGGIFSAQPTCMATITGALPSPTQYTILTNVLSATSLTVGGTTQFTGSSTVNLWVGTIAFDLICMGPR